MNTTISEYCLWVAGFLGAIGLLVLVSSVIRDDTAVFLFAWGVLVLAAIFLIAAGVWR